MRLHQMLPLLKFFNFLPLSKLNIDAQKKGTRTISYYGFSNTPHPLLSKQLQEEEEKGQTD